MRFRTMQHDVAIVDTGVANTASVIACLVKAGAAPFLTTDPEVEHFRCRSLAGCADSQAGGSTWCGSVRGGP